MRFWDKSARVTNKHGARAGRRKNYGDCCSNFWFTQGSLHEYLGMIILKTIGQVSKRIIVDVSTTCTSEHEQFREVCTACMCNDWRRWLEVHVQQARENAYLDLSNQRERRAGSGFNVFSFPLGNSCNRGKIQQPHQAICQHIVSKTAVLWTFVSGKGGLLVVTVHRCPCVEWTEQCSLTLTLTLFV